MLIRIQRLNMAKDLWEDEAAFILEDGVVTSAFEDNGTMIEDDELEPWIKSQRRILTKNGDIVVLSKNPEDWVKFYLDEEQTFSRLLIHED